MRVLTVATALAALAAVHPQAFLLTLTAVLLLERPRPNERRT